MDPVYFIHVIKMFCLCFSFCWVLLKENSNSGFVKPIICLFSRENAF